MKPARLRKNRPLYPVLAAALTLGGLAASCGPLPEVEKELRDSLQQMLPDAGVDAGTVAQPFGGVAPYEDFDGGTAP